MPVKHHHQEHSANLQMSVAKNLQMSVAKNDSARLHANGHACCSEFGLVFDRFGINLVSYDETKQCKYTCLPVCISL